MICSRCKEEIEKHDAILGGYVCKWCGKFNPRKTDRIWCLENGCKEVKEVGKKIEKVVKKGLHMFFRS